MSASTKLYALPIHSRPPKSWIQKLNAVIFFVLFNFGCLMVNGSQFLFLLPLRILPFSWAQDAYGEGIRYTKGAFGILLISISEWFAPTHLQVTFETEGQGRFTDEEIENIVVKNAKGQVVQLKLPSQAILIGNHQVYVDWLYAWCLTYFMGTHKDVFIVLKKSLKWIPIIGWGMQFFDFIFLARSWASDRVHLAAHLSSLGRQAEAESKPLTLILYPEGTLVSKDTRPISKKYADKMGISDMENTLLPRSTGLQYSLRSLSPRMPSLKLIDITMAYPGIPRMGYGQDYYTLRSIFFDRVPPPVIHIHIRVFSVAGDVPIGNVSAGKPNILPHSSPTDGIMEIDVPEPEKQDFDLWLRKLWQDKDHLMSKFLDTGSFVSTTNKTGVQIPLVLRKRREIFDAFCFFLPALVAYNLWTKLNKAVV